MIMSYLCAVPCHYIALKHGVVHDVACNITESRPYRKQTQPVSQKSVTTATPSFGMIRHQNALVMFLASVLMRGTHPLNVRHFEYFHWHECLSQAHWLGIWRQYCNGYAKILGESKTSAFCVISILWQYSATTLGERRGASLFQSEKYGINMTSKCGRETDASDFLRIS